jgi:hypothetical protein
MSSNFLKASGNLLFRARNVTVFSCNGEGLMQYGCLNNCCIAFTLLFKDNAPKSFSIAHVA